jgi:ABC-type polar amino acid transport system ATPase subunit
LELRKRFDSVNLSGDEASKSFQLTIASLEEQRDGYRRELIETKSTLEIAENKLKSLQVRILLPHLFPAYLPFASQDILQNLESSQAERIQMEKDAAELRATQQQERENLHNQTIRELEKQLSETKSQHLVAPPPLLLLPISARHLISCSDRAETNE